MPDTAESDTKNVCPAETDGAASRVTLCDEVGVGSFAALASNLQHSASDGHQLLLK